VILYKFKLSFSVIVDFKKEHPDHLADALRVPIDACILPHDVLYGFDGTGDIAHSLDACP
jgi:hypothetical protein